MFTFIIVGIIWGFTNPLLKKGAFGVDRIKEDTFIGQFISELLFLFTRWQFLVPFLLNQVGFLAYYVSLQTSDLSLAVPMVNSLTFLFTAIAGWAFGESMPNHRSLVGMMLILSGITCYVIDKFQDAAPLPMIKVR